MLHELFYCIRIKRSQKIKMKTIKAHIAVTAKHCQSARNVITTYLYKTKYYASTSSYDLYTLYNHNILFHNSTFFGSLF